MSIVFFNPSPYIVLDLSLLFFQRLIVLPAIIPPNAAPAVLIFVPALLQLCLEKTDLAPRNVLIEPLAKLPISPGTPDILRPLTAFATLSTALLPSPPVNGFALLSAPPPVPFFKSLAPTPIPAAHFKAPKPLFNIP